MNTKRLSYKGFEVWITVDGKEVEHYGVTIDESKNSIKCWIPSEEGKPFNVCIDRAARLDYPGSFKVCLDGHVTATKLVRAGYPWKDVVSYRRVSSTEVCDFKFGSLQSTDDDAYLESNSSQNLGEITLEIHKVDVRQLCSGQKSGIYRQAPEVDKVHERSKKALSHQVHYETRELKLCYPRPRPLVRRLESLATFTFLYRPLAVLQAADIAPYENTVRPVEEKSFPTSPTSCHGQKRKHSDVQQGPDIEDDLEAEEARLLEKLNFIESLRQSEAEKLRSEINQPRGIVITRKQKYSEVKEEPDSTEGDKLGSDDEAALLDQLAAFQSSFQGNCGRGKSTYSLRSWSSTRAFQEGTYPSNQVTSRSSVLGRNSKWSYARFGEARQLASPSSGRPVRFGEKIATYTFLYRPLAMLRATDIAPSESTAQSERGISLPSNPPPRPGQKRKTSDVKQESEDESEDESEETVLLERLASFQASFQTEMERLRSEINDVRSRKANKRSKKKRVKEEPKPSFIPGPISNFSFGHCNCHFQVAVHSCDLEYDQLVMNTRRLSYKGFEIWVTVDGKEVEHYGVTIDQSKNSIKCWIPSEDGKPFAVCLGRAAPLEHPCSLKLMLDGHLVAGRFADRGNTWEASVSGCRVSTTEVRDFKFGTMESTDDDTYLEKSSSLQALGEITVEIYRGGLSGKAARWPRLPEVGKIHERSKKALNRHRVQYGEMKAELPKAPLSIDLLESLATFTLFYRPLAILQASGIAPRDNPVQATQEEVPLPTPPRRHTQKRKVPEVKQESDTESNPDAEEDVLLQRLDSFQSEIEKLRNDITQVRAKKAAKRSKESLTNFTTIDDAVSHSPKRSPMTNKHLSFKNHKVWITVDGKEVEHYNVSANEETNEISCWIPSESDKPFAVCGQSTGDCEPYHYSFDIYLDGHRCLRKLFRKEKWGRKRSLSYSTVSPTEVRDLKFGSLETTDDDALEGSSSSQHIGEIKVKVFRAVVLSEPTEIAPPLKSVPEPGIVHERTLKKGLNHQIKFGETRHLLAPTPFTRFDHLDKIATFIFRYRPLAVLQANAIAPRDSTVVKEEPKPTPSSMSRKRRRKNEPDVEEISNADSDGDVQEVALLERLSSFENEIQRLRKEIQDVRSRKSNKRPRKVVKAEPKTHFVPREVIDLT
ncbi:hypothetical protein CVT26_014902 [Gymnopilus dilepis]|uniref:DUF7918 domain-containing protein n=1 Tax=Gymnopilus dilepis TaxID=231916 RepID=A0A409XWV4_9AGAR|nr:hypothetical protein CVT26_014902 [Gymnopilus dilepis]